MQAKPQAAVPADRLIEQIGELLMHGGTLGSVYDYTDQDYEVLYALGHSLYSQGRYDDAVKAFGFLCIHNHLERRFVNAFAASLQMVKSYEEALKYYTLASVMDMSDPAPTFHSCECLIALGRIAEAREGLEMVIAQCEGAEHAPLKSRAEALRGLIDSQSAAKEESQA
ncbi:MAG TPA: SycD/LcrH family type III secretion system chaperone [Ramlibacter sp.]|jgi:type III secretion system low calcium response chaperone LcrH/SycD|uniref:SycD/LcrH family type III secretion system chaperone n=1 Tax=Ramlibacter sp. TaxID=1917967 RepID=UPI002D3AAB40|nr:SycD/LcrH family type III secretion system chaperone [Ramlibacter sp.]HZY20505.1 SycD/LcrH family type III secretion system chaperone [Ramlibacter sp.]